MSGKTFFCLEEVQKKYFPDSTVMILSKEETEIIQAHRNSNPWKSKTAGSAEG